MLLNFGQLVGVKLDFLPLLIVVSLDLHSLEIKV